MGMVIRPLSLKQANAYVAELHRHNKPTVGHKFSIGCYKNDELVGVAIVGRPLARRLCQDREGDGLQNHLHVHTEIRKRCKPPRLRMD